VILLLSGFPDLPTSGLGVVAELTVDKKCPTANPVKNRKEIPDQANPILPVLATLSRFRYILNRNPARHGGIVVILAHTG
jgi:hypothetical protein